MAEVGIIVVSYCADPQPLFASVGSSRHDVRWYIFVHGQDAGIRARLDAFVSANNARYFPYGINRGLARSWNDGVLASLGDGNDVTLVLNDDLFFYEEAFDQFIEFILSARRRVPEFGVVMTYGMEPQDPVRAGVGKAGLRRDLSHGACFALGRGALDAVGFFDENFWPAYFEDCDYFYRMALAGVPLLRDERTLLQHQRSSTIRRDRVISQLHRERTRRNEEYYVRKWGGGLEQETFATPFNDRSLDLYISAERRTAPYGDGYARGDLAMATSLGFLEGSLREELLAALRRHSGTGRHWLVWGGGDLIPVLVECARVRAATLFLAIDEDRAGLRRTADGLPRYPFLHFRAIACEASADEDAAAAGGAELDYITYPLGLRVAFDTIVVAGRQRMECALVAAIAAAPQAVVIVLDEERPLGRAMRRVFVGAESGAGAVLDSWREADDRALHAFYDTVEEKGRLRVLRPRR